MMLLRRRTTHTHLVSFLLIAACAFVVPSAAQSCELEVRVYESGEGCDFGSGSPEASGSIVADGTCRNAGSNDLLPGIYRAECQSNGRVRFLDSGCSSLDECEQSGAGVCDGDNSVVSYLYARMDNDGVFSTSTCFGGSYTNSNRETITATFYFDGECNPNCQIDPPEPSPTDPPLPPPTDPPPVPAPTDPPVEATDPPVPAPTDPPTPPPIDAPVPKPTEKPTDDETEPTTDEPAESPTEPPENDEPTVTDAPVSTPADPGTVSSSIQAGLRFQPKKDVLNASQRAAWRKVTEDFLVQGNNAITSVSISEEISQIFLRSRFLLQRRGLQEEPKSLELLFTLEGTHDKETNLATLFEEAFDTRFKQNKYLASLKEELDVFDSVESVVTVAVEENAAENDSSNTGIIAGAVVAVAVVALGSGFFLWRRRQQGTSSKPSATQKQINHSAIPQEPTTSSSDPHHVMAVPQHQQQQAQQPLQPRWTNEITLDLQAGDDVSTLEGGTMPDHATLGRVYDDPTATVDLDNYRYNAYGKHRVEQDEGTALSKVSNMGSTMGSSRLLELNDDASFEALFSGGGMASLEETIGTKVKPLVVQAAPGMKLGMVLESEGLIGIPYIRAVKSDSPFRKQVQEGDLVISVNKQDVTNMTAMEVSELISAKQFEHRTIVLVRPERKLDINDVASF